MNIDSKKLEELSKKGLIEKVKVNCKFKDDTFYEYLQKDVYFNEWITRYNTCYKRNLDFWQYLMEFKNAPLYNIRNSRTNYHSLENPSDDHVYEFTFYIIKENKNN